jgi:hypothetical protein
LAPYVKASDNAALCTPLARLAGLSCTAMEHLPFAGNGVVEQLSLVIVNDAGLVPLRIAVPSATATVFGFEITMVPGLPDWPDITVPSDFDLTALRETATPVPANETLGLTPL